MTNRILFAALLMLLPLSGWASFGFTTNADNTITITTNKGGGYVTIPGTINGYPVTTIGAYAFLDQYYVSGVTIPDSVTSIGEGAFFSCSYMTTVTIGHSVTSIGDKAFERCGWLTSVTIPDSVTNIGRLAFNGCGMTSSGMTSITIPNNVISIGAEAFLACGLTSVTIGHSVASIGDFAFENCDSLTSVAIPDSVTSMSNRTFWGCSLLTNITVNVANPSYASAGGVLFDKTLTMLIESPGALAGSYAIPDSVTSIGRYAFGNCSRLRSVTIGNSVTNIGDWAFAWCYGLTNATIGNRVINIGQATFEECTNLHHAYFRGNAPSVNGVPGSLDSSVFEYDTGTVYYVPGTTSWGAYFGGWPTAQWYLAQPQILGSGYGLGAQSNRFQFTISWATNTSVVVEASTNLQSWTPVITNTLVAGTNAFADPTWSNYPQRFYRVRSN